MITLYIQNTKGCGNLRFVYPVLAIKWSEQNFGRTVDTFPNLNYGTLLLSSQQRFVDLQVRCFDLFYAPLLCPHPR
jgi:hypothetical protein